MDQIRADVMIVQRGLAPSRERAQALIEAGMAYVGGNPIRKASQKLIDSDDIEIRGEVCPYVSRGGFKLAKAIEVFHADVRGAVCIDVGASTGGFTDVLLQNGAARVYAVDVGTAQLDPRIAADPRVISMEKTNARELTRADFPVPPTIGAMDVSFISILKLLPALRDVLGDGGRMLALIKPQFEAGRSAIGKNGIVTRPETHRRVLRDIQSQLPQCGWCMRALDFSPVQGGDGNLEFIADLICDTAPCVTAEIDIDAVVRAAHTAFRGRKAPDPIRGQR